MNLSILIPTLGREDILFATVTSLLRQVQAEEEIIIVDQNRPSLLWPIHLKAHPQIRILILIAPSLTKARNQAILNAKHEVLVFLDDDIIPAENLLARLRTANALNPLAVWTGTVEQEDRPSPVSGVGLFNKKTGEIVTDFNNPPTGEISFFPGCLHLLPRSILPKGEVYASAFRGSAQGEEIDLALRLKAKGIAILSDPRIKIRHLKSPTGGCRTVAFRQRFAKDQLFNQGFFFARHGELSSYLHFAARQKGFIEFHARQETQGHDYLYVILLGTWLHLGFLRGLITRPWL